MEMNGQPLINMGESQNTKQGRRHSRTGVKEIYSNGVKSGIKLDRWA